MARRVSWTNNSSGHSGTYVYRAPTLDPQALPEPVATVDPVALGATAEWIDNEELAAGIYYYRTQDFDSTQTGAVSDGFEFQIGTITPVIGWEVGDNANYTLSNDNRTAESSEASWQVLHGDLSYNFTTGKRYFEVYVNDIGSNISVGIDYYGTMSSVGRDSAVYFSGGRIYDDDVYYGAAPYGTGDTVGVAIDYDASIISFYKNGVFVGDQEFPAGLTPTTAISSWLSTATIALNARFLLGPVPAGYLAFDE